MPSRANPGILNQRLGVEISHCTVWALLERQVPNWVQTPWGSALSAALHSTDNKDMFRVWREFASNRSDIAELVCCILGPLDGTGWNEQEKFHSALLLDTEELAVPVDKKLNDWLIILQDTHLTAALAITHEICIECEVPDHSTSTCELPATFTVLQTRLPTVESPLAGQTELLLKPSNLRMSQIGCGSSDAVLYAPKEM
ncbi:MAG: hypothetical protein Q9224_007479 [Gallowayella concinna]